MLLLNFHMPFNFSSEEHNYLSCTEMELEIKTLLFHRVDSCVGNRGHCFSQDIIGSYIQYFLPDVRETCVISLQCTAVVCCFVCLFVISPWAVLSKLTAFQFWYSQNLLGNVFHILSFNAQKNPHFFLFFSVEKIW